MDPKSILSKEEEEKLCDYIDLMVKLGTSYDLNTTKKQSGKNYSKEGYILRDGVREES